MQAKISSALMLEAELKEETRTSGSNDEDYGAGDYWCHCPKGFEGRDCEVGSNKKDC
jgi:hypothetical protein